MRTALTNLAARRRPLVLVLIAALAASTAAWAYWAAQSSGSATGRVGALVSPTLSSATGGGESAALSWSTASAPGSGTVKYYVSRDGAAPSGSCPASSAPSTVTSCTDTGVSPGEHSYTVTAVWRSWSATSNAKSAIVTSKPTVVSASPGSRGQGASGQTITIKGSGFVSGASASFGPGVTVISTTLKSSTELTANITIEAGASVGARTVTVTNPDSGAGSASAFAVNAGPTVTSTSPNSRPQGAAGQTVTIKGSGFVSGASATFGAGVIVSSTTFKSSTELTAKVSVEAGASAGVRTVSVTNPDFGVGSASAFTVNAAPKVESVSPSSRAQGTSSQTIAIKGTGFAGGASVSFSGSSITVESTSFVSSTEVTAKVSISSFASTGARTVTLTNSDGGSDSLANAFTVDAKPNVESASPSGGDRGGTESVAIRGTGFASGATSSFGSGVTVNSTTFKSSTELTASITLESSASLGSRTVTVTNPDAGSDAQTSAFTVNSAPTVTSTSPSARAQGASNQTVAIKGTNFESGAGLAASFSGSGIAVNSTSFVSSTEVTANVTIASNATTGAHNVTVTNPDTTSATATGAFTVGAAPTVESTSPSSRGQGASKQTVAIKGSGFVSGASSSFGSGITVESTSFVSSTELSAKISVESGASIGSRTATVTNPDAGVGSLASAFTVNAGPSVTSASPSSRGQGASKQTVAIKGTGFVTGATASFGSGITVEATSFVSSTELSVKISVESGASTGLRTVTVANPDAGTGSLASAFTVNAGPNITSTSPGSGDRGGTETVLIKGTGFASGATSSFGSGITVNSTTFKSSTELTASITLESSATLGGRTVTVTNTDGGLDTAESAFTVNGAPTVTSISPSARAQGASNQTVAIKGSNFESGTGLAASFSGSGITVNSTSFLSSTEVTANVTIASNATTGARNVTVTNPDTTSATATGAFTVGAAPTVTSTGPSSRGRGASAQTVVIKGSGFAGGASSSFGSGITVESTSFVSSTELSAKISVESGASIGARTVTVTNLDGGAGSLVSAFTVNAGPSITTPTSSFQNRVKITHGSAGEFKVTGTNFVNGAVVSVSGGFTVSSTTFVNAGELKVKVTAPSQKGKDDVTVTNPDGGSDTSEESIESS